MIKEQSAQNNWYHGTVQTPKAVASSTVQPAPVASISTSNRSKSSHLSCSLRDWLLFDNLLLEELVLQLISEANGVLGASWWVWLVDVSSAASSSVKCLVLHAWSQSNFWNGNVVLPLCSFHARRANVGCSTTTSAERTIAMLTSNTLADDLAIGVPKTLSAYVGGCCSVKHTGCYRGQCFQLL